MNVKFERNRLSAEIVTLLCEVSMDVPTKQVIEYDLVK